MIENKVMFLLIQIVNVVYVSYTFLPGHILSNTPSVSEMPESLAQLKWFSLYIETNKYLIFITEMHAGRCILCSPIPMALITEG